MGTLSFTGASAAAFHSTAATYTVTSGSQINTTVPSGATTGPITVRAPGGSVSSSSSFTATSPPTPPHVMVIVEENQEYGSTVGSSDAPYINSLATTYASATQWYAVQHNSPTDYLDLLSGSDQGVPNGIPYSATTLVDEQHTKGIPWQAYMESMPPQNCSTSSTTPDGLYDPSHNPFHYFTNYTSNSGGWCSSGNLSTEGVLPYPGSTGLVTALAGANAPDFVWITPNDCNNMHGDTNTGSPCASSTGSQIVNAGDSWLSSNIGSVISSPWFAQNGIIIITWDEGTTSLGCCSLTAPGGHIPTIVVTSNNKGLGKVTSSGDHYGTLAAIENAYGVPLLLNSANSVNGDLSGAFGPTIGAISGTVTDSVTHVSIAGATVSYSGGNTTTDSSGKYTLPAVAPGTYPVTASANNHVSQSQSVTVTAGATSTTDFALDPALPPPPPPPPPFAPHNVGAPQAAVTPDGSQQLVFWKDTTTNQLAEAWYTNVWNGPAGFPQLGTLTSTPGVAVTKDGSQQLVFWQGPSGHLLEAWYTLGSWHGPLDITNAYLGGQGILASAPSVVTTTDGSQLVFWKGTDGHLGEAWYALGGWHGPSDFTTTGTLGSAPSATVTADNSQQLVFWQGTDNHLIEIWYALGSWHGPVDWTGLGSLSSSPSATVTPDGSQQLVFYKTAAGHLMESWYTNQWNGPVDWTNAAFAGQGLLSSSPSATVTVDGSQQIVFWQGAGSTLWEGWYALGAWHGPVNWSAG